VVVPPADNTPHLAAAAGLAVANFTVASTTRTFDKTTDEWKDGDALFLRCNLWRQPAENTAESTGEGIPSHRHRQAATTVIRDQGR